MNSQSMLDKKRFWEILEYLCEMKGEKSFELICSDLSITRGQLNAFVVFLKDVNYIFESKVDGDTKVLQAPAQSHPIQFKLTILDWLMFQAHFPALENVKEAPFHKMLKPKLVDMENHFRDHDLFSAVESLDKVTEFLSPQLVTDEGLTTEILAFVEEAIIDKVTINIHTTNKNLLITPRKIIFIDEQLCLVCEDKNEKCLLNIPFPTIATVSEDSEVYEEEFSVSEVSEFVEGLQSYGENEVRLVLKIKGMTTFNTEEVSHINFNNECIFTNLDGDYIWAATINKSTDVYEWLNTLETSVEILDPISFKRDFLEYCEDKLKKLA